MNKNQVKLIILMSIVLGNIAVKDLFFGVYKVPPYDILLIVAVHLIAVYLVRTKKKPN
jgi:hypothetical protein